MRLPSLSATPPQCLQVTSLLPLPPHTERLPEEETDQYATPCRTREISTPWGIMQGLGSPLPPLTLGCSRILAGALACPREQVRASPSSPGPESAEAEPWPSLLHPRGFGNPQWISSLSHKFTHASASFTAFLGSQKEGGCMVWTRKAGLDARTSGLGPSFVLEIRLI